MRRPIASDMTGESLPHEGFVTTRADRPAEAENYSVFVLNEKVCVTIEVTLTGSPLIATGS